MPTGSIFANHSENWVIICSELGCLMTKLWQSEIVWISKVRRQHWKDRWLTRSQAAAHHFDIDDVIDTCGQSWRLSVFVWSGAPWFVIFIYFYQVLIRFVLFLLLSHVVTVLIRVVPYRSLNYTCSHLHCQAMSSVKPRSCVGPGQRWSPMSCIRAFGEDLWMPRDGHGRCFYGGATWCTSLRYLKTACCFKFIAWELFEPLVGWWFDQTIARLMIWHYDIWWYMML